LEESLQVAREVGPRAGIARTLSATRAVAETSRDVLRELAEYQRAVQAGGDAGEVSPFTTQRLARTLRVFFERMGATYLKLGQFIASSPTLFPPELVLEMQKCLDQTEPVPYGASLSS
jgi:aarF domain-containing kinase